jgi:hypothetical protein
MALGGGGEIFHAVVDDLDGTAGLAGQQSGMRGDDRGVIFLAAEGSAGFNLDHSHLFGR